MELNSIPIIINIFNTFNNILSYILSYIYINDEKPIQHRLLQKGFKIISTFHSPCNYSEKILQYVV